MALATGLGSVALSIIAPTSSPNHTLYFPAFLAFPTVGALIASRRPDSPIGWIFISVTSVLVGAVASQYAQAASITHSSWPGVIWMAWLGNWIGNPGFLITFTFTLLFFPNGLLSPRWRIIAWAIGIWIAVDTLSAAFNPWIPDQASGFFENPVGIQALGGATSFFQNAEAAIAPVALVLCATSVVFRFRRSTGVERIQLKWFTFAALLVMLVAVLSVLFPSLPPGLGDLIFAAGIISLPTTIGIAILRHRLFDIDFIIRRTLIYAALTALLGLLYLGSVIVLQQLLRGLTGQSSEIAIIISTLAIAVLFNPLRRRVQALIDRRFYRRKYDAQKVLAAFGAAVRDEVDLTQLTEVLVAVVGETIQPTSASVWLKTTEGGKRRMET